jgi:hypothetical protein
MVNRDSWRLALLNEVVPFLFYQAANSPVRLFTARMLAARLESLKILPALAYARAGSILHSEEISYG